MAQNFITSTGNNKSNSQQNNKLIEKFKKKERWMRWAIVAAGVIILLLILLLGYATDWTKGLRKDKIDNTTALESSLDSLKATDAGAANTVGNSGSNGSGGNGGSSGTSGTDGTNGTNGGTTTNSTTTNSSTTTNNSTDTTPPSTSNSGLLSLYNDSGAGDTLQDILDRAEELGITSQCDEGLIVVSCTFDENGESVVVKSLRLNGLVTSVTQSIQQ